MSDSLPQATAPAFFSGPEHQPFSIGEGRVGALLIHGFMGTPAEMRPLAEQLATAGLATRGVLLPGFGPDIVHLAEMTRQKWLAAAAEAWAEVRRDHERTVLIGYSMGAAIAINLAAQQPPDALILIAPFWRMGGWQFKLLPLLRHVVPSIAPFAKANFDDPAIRGQLSALAPEIDLTDPATQQFLREQVRLPLAVLDQLRVMGKEAFDRAATVQAPTLILQGAQDETVEPQYTQLLAARMGSTATLREIPGDHSLVKQATSGSLPLTHDSLEFLWSLQLAETANVGESARQAAHRS